MMPVEITEGDILEAIDNAATGPDYSSYELMAKAVMDKLRGE